MTTTHFSYVNILLVATCALLAVDSPSAQETVTGWSRGDSFGSRIKPAGDWDGDGHADFAVVAKSNKTYIDIVSGATLRKIDQFGPVAGNYTGNPPLGAIAISGNGARRGGVLAISDEQKVQLFSTTLTYHKTLRPPSGPTTQNFGMMVEFAGDVDGDGHEDLLVGAPSFSQTIGSYVFLYSGKTWKPIKTFGGSGLTMTATGDVNRDGVDDFALGNRYYMNLYSGRTLTPLHRFAGYSLKVAGPGDVNRDGHADIAIARIGVTGQPGWVELYSGKDYSLIRRFTGPSRSGRYASQVVGLGDTNGDGHPDLGIGYVDYGTAMHALEIRSGTNGARLSVVTNLISSSNRMTVEGLGDIDGDGRSEYAIGDPAWSDYRGRVLVFGHQPVVVRYGAGCGRMDLTGQLNLDVTAPARDRRSPVGLRRSRHRHTAAESPIAARRMHALHRSRSSDRRADRPRQDGGRPDGSGPQSAAEWVLPHPVSRVVRRGLADEQRRAVGPALTRALACRGKRSTVTRGSLEQLQGARRVRERSIPGQASRRADLAATRYFALNFGWTGDRLVDILGLSRGADQAVKGLCTNAASS